MKIVWKYLCIARARYKQLVISIETMLDISQLSIEDITGRIKVADDVETAPVHTASGKLLLTEEEWVEKYKKRGNNSSRCSSSSGGRGKDRGRGRGHGSGESHPPPDSPCPRCRKKGHWARDCHQKKEEQAQEAHVAQEEEATLMLIITESAEPKYSSPPAVSTQPPSSFWSVAEIHLTEKKVFASLDSAPDRDPSQWILDTGASNHMTGARSAFASLDSGITGSVRFGDGSTTRIEGSSTVLLSCKNGEHRSLPHVYYLPRLTANIISVGQLDEGGYEIRVKDGVMLVRDEEMRLLARIPCGPGRLYVLDATIARPVCLAARDVEDAWVWHARFGHVNFATLRKMARPPATPAQPGGTTLRRVHGREATSYAVPIKGIEALHRGSPSPPRRPLWPDLAANA